jgi:hypothetical protein
LSRDCNSPAEVELVLAEVRAASFARACEFSIVAALGASTPFYELH